MTPSASSSANNDNNNNKRPVVVFISGGAWMIGYKNWGSLMGKIMSSWSDKYGVVFVTPDYRNYPQGNISDMVHDVKNALQWVYDNIQYYNGDNQNIILIGQSAGAHISACMLME